MLRPFIIAVLAIATAQCGTTNLDSTVTAEIDMEVRRELLIMIVEKINTTVKAISGAINECEKKINSTVDSCTTCQNDRCTPSVPLDQAILQTLEAGIMYPVAYAGKGIKEIGNWFSQSETWMGNRAAEFGKAVGTTSKSIGSTLEQSADDAIKTLGQGLTIIGGGFVELGNQLEIAAKDTLNGIINLGSGIASLNTEITSAINSFGSDFTNFFANVGTSISNTAEDIWDSTFGKLGRKKRSAIMKLRQKRCTSSCPSCDNLDTDKYTTDQITEKICGADMVTSRDQALKDVVWLQAMYNTTVTNRLISNIDFDTSFENIDFSGGTAAFKLSHYTINGKRTKFGGLLDASKKEETGKAIAHEYFAAVWNSR